MNAFDWCLVALWLLNAIITVLIIGKPRKPITPESAAMTVAVSVALAIGLYLSRT